jgi:predicted dehydrogenase
MKLTVAIIGSGKSAVEHHIPGYLSLPDVEIAAIADTDAERAKSVARQFGIKGVYEDYAVMLKRRRPQLVSVCCAPSEHRNAVMNALFREAHVLCDMPMALNAEEGKEMLETAEHTEKTLVFAAPHRFGAQANALQQAILSGGLGDVHFCTAWGRKQTIPAEDFWTIKTEQGGGALLVSGQPLIDLALWLMGDEPMSVSGQTFHRFAKNPDLPKTWFGSRREFDADDLAVALIRCRRSLVSLETDWLFHQEQWGLQVVGTKGRGATSPFRVEFTGDGEWVDMTPTFLPGASVWSEVIRSFIDAAQGHQRLFPAPLETLRAQQVCDAIRRSSLSGREILLSAAETNKDSIQPTSS